MDRENAISYLKRKGKIEGKEEFTNEEETEIKDVMKNGKIYGDPIVNLEY